METIKILHLEDNDIDAELIKDILEQGGINAEICHVKDKESYLEQIEKYNYDLVISDYSIPKFDGLKALIEAKKINKNIPFIYCSGTIGEERAVQCLQFGAMDYVIKDRLDRLVPAVKRAFKLVMEMREKEKAEEELAKIRLAVENISEAVMMTDKEEIIKYANPAFCSMYGWERSEVIGKLTPAILNSGEHDHAFFQDMMQKLKEGKSVNVEMINKTKDGKLVDVKNIINPMIDKNNELHGYISIQMDIMSQKKYEREILQAKTEAEELNKLKSFFLANISHEMRTPLISILGFSELLLNELNDQEQAEYAKHIYDAGRRLHETIESILALQDIEKNNIEISPLRFNLIDLLNNIITKYQKDANRRGLSLKINATEKKIWLNTDKSLLEKVITKVIDNSLKFTKKGEIEVSALLRIEGEKTEAVIITKDTGVGISHEKMQQIFSPFRQESEGFNRAFEGMGLGLYIAKQILDLLKGEIEVNSEPGLGTEVSIKIPASVPDNEISKIIDIRKITIAEDLQEEKHGKHNVLLVEDNVGNRTIIKRYLRHDFFVDEAEDGITAVSKAEVKHYDLILMDINLGLGIDGVETFHRIRENEKNKNIPVIAITAYALRTDRDRFIEYGFDEYMQKPVVKEELIGIVRKLIHSNK